MANNYSYQFQFGQKPKMANIEGRVMIGTGGQVDAQTASGTTYGNSLPSGWIGSYSGCIGLIKAGLASVARTTTGTYLLGLMQGYTKPLHSCQTTYYSGATAAVGASGTLDIYVASANVGYSAGGPSSTNPSTITVCVSNSLTGLLQDPPAGAGFMVAIRLADSAAGPQ